MTRRKGSMEPLSALVTKVYPSHEPEEARALRVFGNWNRVVTERVLKNAAPVNLKYGVLTVHTSTAAWANALSLESSQLLAKLRVRVPDVTLSRIAFRVGKIPVIPDQVAREKEIIPTIPLRELPEEVARELAHIADDGLRESVARAASISLGKPASTRKP